MVSREEIKKRMEDGLTTTGIPHLYVNGFTNSLTASDVTVVLEQNTKPVAVLNMSYTTTKTLSVKLGQIIATLEAASGRPMLTTEEVSEALQAAESKNK